MLWKLRTHDCIAVWWEFTIHIRLEHGGNHVNDRYEYCGYLFGDDH